MTNPSPQGGETPRQTAERIWQEILFKEGNAIDRIEAALTRATQENEELRGSVAWWKNDSAQAWDTCEKRRLETVRLRALLVEAQGALQAASQVTLPFSGLPTHEADLCKAVLTRLNAELGEGRTHEDA